MMAAMTTRSLPVRPARHALRALPVLPALLCVLLAAGCFREAASTEPLAPGGSAGTAAQALPVARFVLEDEPFCDSCTSNVHAILDGLPGVGHVEVRVGSRDLAVTYDPRATSAETLLAALAAGGRPAQAAP